MPESALPAWLEIACYAVAGFGVLCFLVDVCIISEWKGGDDGQR